MCSELSSVTDFLKEATVVDLVVPLGQIIAIDAERVESTLDSEASPESDACSIVCAAILPNTHVLEQFTMIATAVLMLFNRHKVVLAHSEAMLAVLDVQLWHCIDCVVRLWLSSWLDIASLDRCVVIFIWLGKLYLGTTVIDYLAVGHQVTRHTVRLSPFAVVEERIGVQVSCVVVHCSFVQRAFAITRILLCSN